VELVNGYAFKPSDWKKSGLPIIRIQNLNKPDADFNYFDGALLPKYQVRNGDLLFAWSGTPGTSFGAHIWHGSDAWLNQHIFNVRFNDQHLNKRFLRYAINQNLSEYITAAHGGAGLAHITKGVFERSELFIPPLAEQRRIVEAIETQLTRLDAAVAALDRARANLKRYRAVVLKAACEGRLVPTEAELARAEGRAYEPASVLLERIAAARQETGGRWQAADSQAEVIPQLPPPLQGWCWASVKQLGALGHQPVLTGPFGSSLGRSDFQPTGVPVLTIGCLTDSGVVLDKALYVSDAKARKLSRYRLEPGDLLFSRMASVGRAGIVPERLTGSIINYHIMRLRLARSALLPEYFLCYARGSKMVEDYLRRVNHGATRDGINTEQLLSMPVALPPLAEQHRIVAEVERRLSVVEEMERGIAANLKRAERLRQAVLKRAFEGKLVAQDPADEPASVLLERIRAARAEEPAVGRRSSRTKTAKQVVLPLPSVK
jgi:type I restriction enzyme S subunit